MISVFKIQNMQHLRGQYGLGIWVYVNQASATLVTMQILLMLESMHWMQSGNTLFITNKPTKKWT